MDHKLLYYLRTDILAFYEKQAKNIWVWEWRVSSWLFAFLSDMLTELNTKVQGVSHLISDLYQHVEAFRGYVDVDPTQSDNNTEMFPIVADIPSEEVNLNKYRMLLQELKDQFQLRFKDFQHIKNDLSIFASPPYCYSHCS